MREGDNLQAMEALAAGDGPAAEAMRAELKANRPESTSYESFVWAAYWTIATARPPSMAGFLPIPWKEVIAYIDHSEMTRSMGEKLMLELMALDHHYVTTKNKGNASRSK